MALRFRALDLTRVEVAHVAALNLGDLSLLCCARFYEQPATDTTFLLIAKGDRTDGNFWLGYRDVSGVKQLFAGYYDTTAAAVREVSANLTLTTDRYYSLICRLDVSDGDFFVYSAARETGEHEGQPTAYTSQANEQPATATTPQTNSRALTIGCGITAAGLIIDPASADIEEVVIYNTPLTVIADFNAKLAKRHTGAESGVEVYLRGDDGDTASAGGAVTVWTDRSGNGRDGTLKERPLPVDGAHDLHYETGIHDWALVGWLDATKRRAAVVTASEEQTGYEADRLRDGRPGSVWRSTDAAALRSITVDAGDAITIMALQLAGFNWSSAVTLLLEGDTESGFTAPPYSATVTFEPTRIIHILSTPQQLRWWRLSMTDTSLSFHELGQLGLWHCLEIANRVGQNIQWQAVDASSVRSNRLSQRQTDTKARLRQLGFSFRRLRREDAQELDRAIEESHGEVLIMPDPKRSLATRSCYGVLTSSGTAAKASRSGVLQDRLNFAVLEA